MSALARKEFDLHLLYFQLWNYTPAVVPFYFLVAYLLVFVWSIQPPSQKKIKLVQCQYQLTTEMNGSRDRAYYKYVYVKFKWTQTT